MAEPAPHQETNERSFTVFKQRDLVNADHLEVCKKEGSCAPKAHQNTDDGAFCVSRSTKISSCRVFCVSEGPRLRWVVLRRGFVVKGADRGPNLLASRDQLFRHARSDGTYTWCDDRTRTAQQTKHHKPQQQGGRDSNRHNTHRKKKV